MWLIWSKLPQYRSFTLNLLSLNVPAASATAAFCWTPLHQVNVKENIML